MLANWRSWLNLTTSIHFCVAVLPTYGCTEGIERFKGFRCSPKSLKLVKEAPSGTFYSVIPQIASRQMFDLYSNKLRIGGTIAINARFIINICYTTALEGCSGEGRGHVQSMRSHCSMGYTSSILINFIAKWCWREQNNTVEKQMRQAWDSVAVIHLVANSCPRHSFYIDVWACHSDQKLP